MQTAQLEALIRKPIKELVDELDPHLFWQIHRSTLVNVKAIAGVTRATSAAGRSSASGATAKLEVSRSYTHLFRGCDTPPRAGRRPGSAGPGPSTAASSPGLYRRQALSESSRSRCRHRAGRARP